MVTLKDIAQKTGFSLSVVSRAMNPAPDQKVAERSREIILAAAADLGYRPNQAARLLAKGRSASIGCFLPAMVGELVGKIVEGLSKAANQNGFAYQIYFGNSLEDYRHFIDHCRHTASTGMISYLPWDIYVDKENDSFYRMLASLPVNSSEIILLNCPDLNLPHVQTICIDNYHAGKIAAEHLIKRQCSCCVLLAGNFAIETYQLSLRSNGFIETVTAHGCKYEQVLLNNKRGYQPNDDAHIDKLLDLLKKYSDIGVFLQTDYTACVFYSQLQQRNLQHLIGKEIKVIGCDNIFAGALLTPSLTTVSLLEPFAALGEVSMATLLNKLVKADMTVDWNRLKPQLVIRESA
ncbi:MAG: LacI family transcriptional regulator [Lentisphaerae bacterium]|nr:LacI family transcriptional regulator [Lentisphaerota bacterium]